MVVLGSLKSSKCDLLGNDKLKASDCTLVGHERWSSFGLRSSDVQIPCCFAKHQTSKQLQIATRDNWQFM